MPRSTSARKASARDPLENILDAAEACFAQFGIRKTTIEDVAKAARVSRPTVYKFAGSKKELILRIAIRTNYRLNQQTQKVFRRYKDLDRATVEAVVTAAREALDNPMVRYLVEAPNDEFSTETALQNEEILAMECAEWRPAYETAKDQGRLREGISLQDFAVWVTEVQLMLMLRSLSSGAGEDSWRDTLQKFLLPSIYRAKRKA